MKIRFACLSFAFFAALPIHSLTAEDWTQFKFDSRHSGNAVDRSIDIDSLGLLGAVPLSDGIYTSPVIADGRIFVVDGSGKAVCWTPRRLT